MSDTIGDLVDRVFREWLTVPDDQVSQAALSSALNISDQTFVIEDVLTVEEEALLGAGVVGEIDQELLRCTDYNETTRTVTVAPRGSVMGTVAATHDQYAPFLIAPSYARQAVFDAMADSIVELYPDLWAVTTTDVNADKQVDFDDASAVGIVKARWEASHRWIDTDCALVLDWPDSTTGVALEFPDSDVWGQTVFVTYRYKIARPASGATTLAAAGLDTAWERLLVVATAGALLAGQEIDQTSSEYLTEALERAGMPFGEITDVATQLLRYRLLLLNQAKRALTARYDTRVSVKPSY